MAFSSLFRRYSTSNDLLSTSQADIDQNSIAETLLDELESQCQNCLTLMSLKNKRNSQLLMGSPVDGLVPQGATDLPVTKRHASVDYSWLTPNNNQASSANEMYHLSDIIKMELGELIRNVAAEDCTSIINQFRRHIRAQTKPSTPENIIALFRKTISDYIDQKPKHRLNGTTMTTTTTATMNNELIHAHLKHHSKPPVNSYPFGRTNRINPKYQRDDEQHCIAELTEISISSSSNDATDIGKSRSTSQA